MNRGNSSGNTSSWPTPNHGSSLNSSSYESESGIDRKLRSVSSASSS